MRVVPAAMTNAWKAEKKTADKAPTVRATIQVANLRRYEYDTAMTEGGDFGTDRHRSGYFTSIVFGDPSILREMRNIKSYSWSRSVDQDVATCTLTLLNTDLTPIGNQEELSHTGDFDLPGYFTFNRGQQEISANRWGYTNETGWQNVIVPDRVVKTYEGYGTDDSVPPSLDPNLVQSGTWLIDTVTYTKDGDIVLEMRDLGRLLLDQIVFPPVVPYAEYPLSWDWIRTEQVPSRDATGGAFERPKGAASSSNDKYIGKGITNPPFNSYVGSNGGVNGHHAAHALVNQEYEWWMSTGQETMHSKVWWQVDLSTPVPVAALRIHPHGGPYRIYISIKTANGWVGKRKIPYKVTTEGVNLKADIPFVQSVIADKRNYFDVTLRRKYAGVEAIRLTFTKLMDGVGKYPYQAGLRDIQIYTADSVADLAFKKGKVAKVVGNYRDYTDLVKWVCAWGGFYWPPHSTDDDFIQLSYDGNPNPDYRRKTISYATRDTVLPEGRVWGDFMRSGTYAESALTVDLFDKQPLMNVINYVRDVLGFIFFVDETGGVVWRLPNLGLNVEQPKLGNYLSPGNFGQRTRSRTGEVVTIDENDTLVDYSTTLSSENLRERIFVADNTGKKGTVIRGYTPAFSAHGLRRMAGWTDQHFESKRETKVMADMVSARQMFDYRRGKVTIPGYPKIQIDDQIRIFEKVTNETYYHYVLGVDCELDMETRVWTYTLDTHWLGERPADAWVVNVDELDAVTVAYLNQVGVGD